MSKVSSNKYIKLLYAMSDEELINLFEIAKKINITKQVYLSIYHSKHFKLDIDIKLFDKFYEKLILLNTLKGVPESIKYDRAYDFAECLMVLIYKGEL